MTDFSSIPVAIVGCGRMGRTHALECARLGTKVTVVCDPDRERAETLGREVGCERILTDPQQIANAWGSIDKNLTAMAPTISWIWDKNANIESKNVQGVIDQDNGLWALAYTSLK